MYNKNNSLIFTIYRKKTHPQTSQLGNGNRFSKKCVGLSARVLCENHHVDTDIDDNPLPRLHTSGVSPPVCPDSHCTLWQDSLPCSGHDSGTPPDSGHPPPAGPSDFSAFLSCSKTITTQINVSSEKPWIFFSSLTVILMTSCSVWSSQQQKTGQTAIYLLFLRS